MSEESLRESVRKNYKIIEELRAENAALKEKVGSQSDNLTWLRKLAGEFIEWSKELCVDQISNLDKIKEFEVAIKSWKEEEEIWIKFHREDEEKLIRADEEIAALKEKLAQSQEREVIISDKLKLILPLAKGYAAEHPVGSNQKYVELAEDAVLDDSGKPSLSTLLDEVEKALMKIAGGYFYGLEEFENDNSVLCAVLLEKSQEHAKEVLAKIAERRK